jgi:hypothetical protein
VAPVSATVVELLVGVGVAIGVGYLVYGLISSLVVKIVLVLGLAGYVYLESLILG